MSAADLISSFGENYTVFRDLNTEQTLKGKRVADKWQTLTFLMSIQPLREDEIQEDSNERNSDGIKIYSFDELKVVDQATGLKADVVSYLGDEFEVRKVAKYREPQSGLIHYRSQAFKLNKARS